VRVCAAPPWIVTVPVGATVSTVNDRCAGVGSSLPASSRARTEKVCGPSTWVSGGQCLGAGAAVGPRPVLLIQAGQGSGGEELNPVYTRRAGAGAGLWPARGTHSGALAAQPAEYERRVIAFFGEALR